MGQKEQRQRGDHTPSLEQVHVVELVELHRELHRGLDFSHLGLYRQGCLTSSGVNLQAYR